MTERLVKTGRGRGTYCSVQCKNADNRMTKKCERCGKEFTIPKNRAKDPGRGRFCTAKCALDALIEKKHVKYTDEQIDLLYKTYAETLNATEAARVSGVNVGYARGLCSGQTERVLLEIRETNRGGRFHPLLIKRYANIKGVSYIKELTEFASTMPYEYTEKEAKAYALGYAMAKNNKVLERRLINMIVRAYKLERKREEQLKEEKKRKHDYAKAKPEPSPIISTC